MTTNQHINTIIDRMYSIRSQIRGIYLNSSTADIFDLEDSIKYGLGDILNKKTTIDVHVKEFEISICFDTSSNKKLSNRAIQNVYFRIDDKLRNYIRSHTSDKDILEYINNTNNSIVDYYQIGDGIKFLL